MSKKNAKKPARKTGAPKSKREVRPQQELSDEELSRASGGTLALSSPWTIKLSPENPTATNPTTTNLTTNLDAGLWLLKK